MLSNCLLGLIFIVIFSFCFNNNDTLNIEKFNNFKDNFIEKCKKSLMRTENIKCQYNQYKNNTSKNYVENCPDNTMHDDAKILNSSDFLPDIINRRLTKNWLGTLEINSEINDRSWCEN